MYTTSQSFPIFFPFKNRNFQWNNFIDNKNILPTSLYQIHKFFTILSTKNLINIAFYAVVFDIYMKSHCMRATHWFRNRISALWSNIVNFILDAICLPFASCTVNGWKAADNLTRLCIHNTGRKRLYMYIDFILLQH